MTFVVRIFDFNINFNFLLISYPHIQFIPFSSICTFLMLLDVVCTIYFLHLHRKRSNPIFSMQISLLRFSKMHRFYKKQINRCIFIFSLFNFYNNFGGLLNIRCFYNSDNSFLHNKIEKYQISRCN